MSRRHKAANLIDKLFPLIKEITADFRIVSSPGKTLKSIFSISLYRNAIYLLSSTIVLSLTGFVFWIVAARLYSTESVGLASALVAAMGLLAALSTLGLDFAIIGFWHNAGEQSRDMINSCMTVIVLASITVSIIFIIGLNFWSPALLTIREHPLFLFLFVMTVVATAVMTLNRQVFVAQRKAAFTLVQQGLIFGILRFVPLVLLATYFETFGIFTSWGIAVLLAVVISVLFLIPRVESSYSPRPIVRKKLIKDMVGFSFTNYSAQIATVLPQFVLPLLVVNLVGEKQNAYFYVCWAIGNILFMIPTSVSMSLFAEGSHDKTRLKQEVKQCFKLIAYILGPAVLLLLLFGGKLLLLFGKPYSENGTHLLWVLALSAIPVSINYIYFSIKRVEMQMRSVVLFSWIIAIATLIMSYFLLPHMGITWIGVAWLSINAIVAALISREFFKNQA